MLVRLDRAEVERTLLYCLAVPLPVFILSICYLCFAYTHIYSSEAPPQQEQATFSY